MIKKILLCYNKWWKQYNILKSDILKSFLFNSSDYLKVLIPLLIIYRICLRNKEHINSHRTKLNRFLRILSFGSEKDIDGNEAECLLPTSKDDAIFEKFERNEMKQEIQS